MSEIDELRTRVANLEDEKASLVETITNWFEIKSLCEAELLPEVKSYMGGYLRRSRCGGMPTEESNVVEASFENFADHSFVTAIWPIMLRLAEKHSGRFALPEGISPAPVVTDGKLLEVVNRTLDKIEKFPVDLVDMTDREREIANVANKMSGNLMFISHILTERVRRLDSLDTTTYDGGDE